MLVRNRLKGRNICALGLQRISLTGSPTGKRQREMDDLCALEHPGCIYPGTETCPTSGRICHARFTPKQGDNERKWRCLFEKAVSPDSQIWNGESTCYYSTSDELRKMALRYPVLGDFEKQLWLDTFCQTQDTSSCSEPYFAQYNASSQEFECRTVGTTSSCPIQAGLHDDLDDLTTGKGIINSGSSFRFST